MRSAAVAIGATAGSSVNTATTAGATATNTTASTPRTPALYAQVRHTEASARSGLPAPRFWPTSVAAAFDKPHDGISTNIRMRTAIVHAATATLPNDAMMRITPI